MPGRGLVIRLPVYFIPAYFSMLLAYSWMSLSAWIMPFTTKREEQKGGLATLGAMPSFGFGFAIVNGAWPLVGKVKDAFGLVLYTKEESHICETMLVALP